MSSMFSAIVWIAGWMAVISVTMPTKLREVIETATGGDASLYLSQQD